MKAVVDAYTGQVTLYEWNQADQPDPLLQTWENAFPGLVKPQSDIPPDLLPHLRYPQDLFDVQRSLLTQYHVTDPGDFYNGSAFWKVPERPDRRRDEEPQRRRHRRSHPRCLGVHVARPDRRHRRSTPCRRRW